MLEASFLTFPVTTSVAGKSEKRYLFTSQNVRLRIGIEESSENKILFFLI